MQIGRHVLLVAAVVVSVLAFTSTAHGLTINPAGTFHAQGTVTFAPDTSTVRLNCTDVTFSATFTATGTAKDFWIVFDSCSDSFLNQPCTVSMSAPLELAFAGAFPSVTNTNTLLLGVTCVLFSGCVATITAAPPWTVTVALLSGNPGTVLPNGNTGTDGTPLCTADIIGFGDIDHPDPITIGKA
jgi:hypothetical protein